MHTQLDFKIKIMVVINRDPIDNNSNCSSFISLGDLGKYLRTFFSQAYPIICSVSYTLCEKSSTCPFQYMYRTKMISLNMLLNVSKFKTTYQLPVPDPQFVIDFPKKIAFLTCLHFTTISIFNTKSCFCCDFALCTFSRFVLKTSSVLCSTRNS